jgi:ABC-2 type transport system ATP-binding protein
MDRGKVVLTGAMATLTATDHVTLIGLADGADTAAAVRSLADRGLHAEPENGQIRVSGEQPRAQIVAGLVADGFPVDSVDGRRQLEEVFMTLVGSSGPGRE